MREVNGKENEREENICKIIYARKRIVANASKCSIFALDASIFAQFPSAQSAIRFATNAIRTKYGRHVIL